jgi:hypothetical protein
LGFLQEGCFNRGRDDFKNNTRVLKKITRKGERRLRPGSMGRRFPPIDSTKVTRSNFSSISLGGVQSYFLHESRGYAPNTLQLHDIVSEGVLVAAL